jgi:recombination protein RecA
MAQKKKALKILTESAIRKKYPNASTATVLLPDEDTIWLPSRNLPLNYQMGGGIPYGKIVEIFGWESTGKSLLAMDFAYCAQALGGIILWGDLESAWTNYWAEQNGLDCDLVEVYGGNDIEGLADWCRDLSIYYRSKLTDNEPILLVIDSIAAGETDDNLDADIKGGKAEMGNRAKAWEKLYRRRQNMFKKYGITCIVINQIRDKIGASMFELAETTPGGKGTKFYASQRICISKGKQILNSKKKKVGQIIYTRIVKNKVAPPKSSNKGEVHFTDELLGYVGFSRYASLLEIGLEEDVITKQGKSRYYLGDKMIANGADNAQEAIESLPKLRRALIKKLGINTINKTLEKIEAMDHNMFPVKIKTEEE